MVVTLDRVGWPIESAQKVPCYVSRLNFFDRRRGGGSAFQGKVTKSSWKENRRSVRSGAKELGAPYSEAARFRKESSTLADAQARKDARSRARILRHTSASAT
ncbi:uncharacterized protein LOC143423718 [Xylocopa sonorina]|uniref:uncharacterized protein LOC143423718 n=1 Tax=Xylocopa sonorina TaxID=1818115 RepID=UPI00403ACDE3